MTVRAKLRLTSITHDCWGQTKLKFDAEYDAAIEEDRRFQSATPTATAEFMIDNPKAVAQFEIGKKYYVDFTPASEAA